MMTVVSSSVTMAEESFIDAKRPCDQWDAEEEWEAFPTFVATEGALFSFAGSFAALNFAEPVIQFIS